MKAAVHNGPRQPVFQPRHTPARPQATRLRRWRDHSEKDVTNSEGHVFPKQVACGLVFDDLTANRSLAPMFQAGQPCHRPDCAAARQGHLEVSRPIHSVAPHQLLCRA